MGIDVSRRVSAVQGRSKTSRVYLLAALVSLLALPSIGLLCFVPPLWRDSDGFYQVATKFEFLTVLHWPPLYCFCARIPFFLAAILDGSLFRSGFSWNWPRITDLGIYLLLIAQHLFLVGALVGICLTLAKSWLVRFLIAAVFVSIAPFYAFAHCVGSESIMAPLLLLGSTAGLRYFCSPSRRWLILLFCLIALNILDRHANGVIAGLVPLALLLSLCASLARPSIARVEPTLFWTTTRRFLVATGIALAAILAANGIILAVCRFDKIPYRSRAGYAFVWRLDFFKDLPPPQQTTIISKAESDLNDPAMTAALETLKELSARGTFDPDQVCTALDKAIGEEGYQGQQRHVQLDQKLNRFLTYFLLNHPGELFHAVARDVATGMSFTPGLLTKDPFLCTDWLVKRLSELRFQPIQGLRTLSTDSGAVAPYNVCPYFQFWNFLPFSWVVAGIFVAGLVVIVTGKELRDLRLAIYAIACAVTGIVSTIVSFTVVALLPRLMLPTLILLVFAVVVLLLRFDRPGSDHPTEGAVATT